MDKEELRERLNSLQNRIDVCRILFSSNAEDRLLHTIIEDMAGDMQAFIELCKEEGLD